MSLVTVGHELWLPYPVCNRIGVPIETLERHVLVDRVKHSPLIDVADILRDPLCRRGRTLIIGYDLIKERERAFWLEASHPDAELPTLNLGLVDPDGEPGDLIDSLDDGFAPTVYDRLRMRDTVLDIQSRLLGRVAKYDLVAYIVED